MALKRRSVTAKKAKQPRTRRKRGRLRRLAGMKKISVDQFILSSFIEGLVKKGYTSAEARKRAKKLLAAPGFPEFPDAVDQP